MWACRPIAAAGARRSRWSLRMQRAGRPTGRPALCIRGTGSRARARSSEAVTDLVGPEPLQAPERQVEAPEIVVRDAADRLDRAGVLVVEALDDVVDLTALVGEADAHRAPVRLRACVVQVA